VAYTPKKKRPADPITPACNKRIYNSLAEAEEMIRHIRENRHVRDLSAYQCPICGMWHLTSKSTH
jgi:hypothetical protein